MCLLIHQFTFHNVAVVFKRVLCISRSFSVVYIWIQFYIFDQSIDTYTYIICTNTLIPITCIYHHQTNILKYEIRSFYSVGLLSHSCFGFLKRFLSFKIPYKFANTCLATIYNSIDLTFAWTSPCTHLSIYIDIRVFVILFILSLFFSMPACCLHCYFVALCL